MRTWRGFLGNGFTMSSASNMTCKSAWFPHNGGESRWTGRLCSKGCVKHSIKFVWTEKISVGFPVEATSIPPLLRSLQVRMAWSQSPPPFEASLSPSWIEAYCRWYVHFDQIRNGALVVTFFLLVIEPGTHSRRCDSEEGESTKVRLCGSSDLFAEQLPDYASKHKALYEKSAPEALIFALWTNHIKKCCGIFCCSVKAFNSSNSYSAFKFSSSSWGLESKPWSWARTIFRWKPSNIYYKFWVAAPWLNSRFSKHSCSASQYNIAICMYIYIYMYVGFTLLPVTVDDDG